MSALSKKLRGIEGGRIGFWCPGCEGIHVIKIKGDEHPVWQWDGNVEVPTVSPSILVTYQDLSGENHDERCHSFVKAGHIQFLPDCTHSLAGQTVPIPNWPYAEGEYGGV